MIQQTESLNNYASRVGIKLLSNDSINGELLSPKNTTKISFNFINGCNHTKTMQINSLPKDGKFKCVSCSKNNTLIPKYVDKCDLSLNFIDNTITCNCCERKYNRLPNKLTKDINKFKCYCKLDRDNEQSFYDQMRTLFGDKFYKNYNGYKTGKNHSSDFFIQTEQKTFIIHLDDDSHRAKLNRSRDLYKLDLCKGNNSLINIYVHQTTFIRKPETVFESIQSIVDNDSGCSIHCISDSKTFYNYIQDHEEMINSENE